VAFPEKLARGRIKAVNVDWVPIKVRFPVIGLLTGRIFEDFGTPTNPLLGKIIHSFLNVPAGTIILGAAALWNGRSIVSRRDWAGSWGPA